ncbi:MAG: hypothetical protein ACE5J3_05120 [Methanosarcinales archaeon]
MKGIAPVIAIAIIGGIAIGTIVTLILSVVFLRIHLIEVVDYRYEYDNSQLYLLTLLSKTYDGKPIYTQIADHLQTGEPDISFVKSELKRIVGDKCYKLFTPTEIIAQSDCTPSKYTVQTKIVLPYNPNRLVETLTLVVD